MKLAAFSIRNYRSIVEANNLLLDNYTVLVGPNNEGKSNIVKAIALSLNVLTKSRPYRRTHRSSVRYYSSPIRFNYDWTRDFPVSLQKEHPTGCSEFTLEFDFTTKDFQEFRKSVGINLSTNLRVKLGFGPDDVITRDILMKGKGKKTLNSNHDKISEFIRTRVSSQYISALRSSEMATGIIADLIQGELSGIESDSEYKSLLTKLKKIQQPMLDKIADKLKKTVSDFIPAVRGVRITNELERAFRTSFNIMVDDGAETELALKGDGIISLMTMSLMKHVSEEGINSESSILLIEEPESHLHPEAIHGLRQVLRDISKGQQVIITTHSPILVERGQISQNILVRNGQAVKAKQISEIRQILGIQLADNLMGAYVVLLVEGQKDEDLLKMWLSSLSVQLKSALSRNLLIIDHLGGATNLSYKVSFYRQNVYNIHVFLDHDEAGRQSIKDAIDKKLIEEADYNLATCQDMKNSEIEDLINLETYAPDICEHFGVDLTRSRFKRFRAEWSERASRAFQASGKIWDKSVEKQVKSIIVKACIDQGISSLNTHRREPIDTLVSSLEAKLATRVTLGEKEK